MKMKQIKEHQRIDTKNGKMLRLSVYVRLLLACLTVLITLTSGCVVKSKQNKINLTKKIRTTTTIIRTIITNRNMYK